jgi:hypothetical protein
MASPNPDISKRLAEIRERDELVHDLHGSGWDDYATDAEKDRSALLAALDAVLAEAEQTDKGARLAADLELLEAGDADLVLHVTGKVRERIAAALETGGGEADD